VREKIFGEKSEKFIVKKCAKNLKIQIKIILDKKSSFDRC